MLMLVVTIIIAAVVAAFAGGLVTNTEKSPTTVLDVHIYSAADAGGTMSSTYAPDFTTDDLSGDPLDTSDLKITFSWTKATTGKIYSSIYDGPGTNNFSANFTSYSYENSSLYLNQNPGIAFGEGILTPGDHVQTGANYLYQDYIVAYGGTGTTIVHQRSPFMDDLMGRDLSQNSPPLVGDAGGLTDSTTATPNALITVQDVSTSSGYLNEILFIHKGGDSLSLANIKVSLQSFGMTSEFTGAEGTLTGDTTVSVGNQITVDASGAWIYTPSESVIDYTIIDLTTGNAIGSDNFVVP
jgi:FlaG/FlaF family flagellin (archaellin)